MGERLKSWSIIFISRTIPVGEALRSQIVIFISRASPYGRGVEVAESYFYFWLRLIFVVIYDSGN